MRYTAVLLLACALLPAQTEIDWVNRGVQAFKNTNYAEALNAFQHAVDLNPGSVTARLYLATAYMQSFIPGAEAAENLANADRAETEFQRVLAIEPANKVALASLASLQLNRKRFDDARAAYKRLLAIDPAARDAYYSIGFTIWAQWYPAYAAARAKAGMRQEDPGPLTDAAARASLRAQWWTALDEGIWNLKRALDLDPEYSDAMAYMNLFIRERADLRDSKTEYEQDVREADDWVRRALDAKRTQAGRMQTPAWAPPPPPPPPGGNVGYGGGDRSPAVPQRIKISGQIQERKLIAQPQPVYPEAALQARIQGTVKLSALIGKDGRVANLEVVSGHPLLVAAALDAVKGWQYQPTLLNGEPVEVQTQVEVNFVLPR